MLNALLFAALSLNAATGINPDSSANKNVPLDEIVVTDFTRVRDKKRLEKVGNLVKNSYLYR